MGEPKITAHGNRLITIQQELLPRVGKRQPVYGRMLVQITTAGTPRALRGSLLWSRDELTRFLMARGVL
jgi:hypothetical protein